MRTPTNLKSKFELFIDHWSPKIIVGLNDYQFKLVKIEGQLTRHEHKGTDEVFLVIECSIGIDFKDKIVSLKEGQMIVLKKGEQHKPFAFEEWKVLMVEPRGVANTGDSSGNLTSENDIWI